MRLLLLFTCLILALPAFAQKSIRSAKAPAAGMEFVEKPFAELLVQAKAEDKIIFIDAYTTWCGPCKMMAAKVFPDERVGKVYNERFINAKFDMEKGEGIELAKRYSVAAYPTYLFIDGDGDIVHKGLGYIPQEQFLALADAAVSDDNLGSLNRRYDAGQRDGEFLKIYAATLSELYERERAAVVMGEYLATLDDWSAPETLKMLLENPGEPGGKTMNYLVDNASATMEAVGAGSFLATLQQTLITHHLKATGGRTLPELDDLQPVYAKYAAPIEERLIDHYNMFKAQMSRDPQANIDASLAYYEKYPADNWNDLNNLAWTIFESSEDATVLAKGLELAKKSVAMEANYMNLDTLAWLYEKTGDHDKAVEAAERAIAIAKEEDIDYSETAKILEK